MSGAISFQVLLAFGAPFREDSPLWAELDDGTWGPVTAAFIERVVLPAIDSACEQCKCTLEQVHINNGNQLVDPKATDLLSLVESRERAWESNLEKVGCDKFKNGHLMVREADRLHHQILIQGHYSAALSPNPFDQDNQGLSCFFGRTLMELMGKGEMLYAYLIGSSECQENFVHYYYWDAEYSSDSDGDEYWKNGKVKSYPAIVTDSGQDPGYVTSVCILRECWQLEGEVLSSVTAFSDLESLHQQKILSTEKIAIVLKDMFDEDPDLVIGDEYSLVLMRSGDLGDDSYSVTLEKVLLDDDGDIEDYEILGSYDSSIDALKTAWSDYISNGGDESVLLDSVD